MQCENSRSLRGQRHRLNLTIAMRSTPYTVAAKRPFPWKAALSGRVKCYERWRFSA